MLDDYQTRKNTRDPDSVNEKPLEGNWELSGLSVVKTHAKPINVQVAALCSCATHAIHGRARCAVYRLYRAGE